MISPDFNVLSLVAKTCAVDPGEGLRMVNTDTAVVEESAPSAMTIAPNPATSNVTVTVPVSGNNNGKNFLSSDRKDDF